jgi:hypothetical protein
MSPCLIRRFVPALVCVGVLAVVASAHAATSATTSQRVYAIEIRADQRIVAITPSQISQAIARTQKRLTPCALQIAGEVPASQTAARQALSRELGAQYVADALAPALSIASHRNIAFKALPATAAFRTANQTYIKQLSQLAALDVCADLATWQKTDFSVSSEPPATAAISSIHTVAPEPTALLPPTEFHALKRESATATANLGKLNTRVQTSLPTWLQNLPVQAAPPAN